MEISAFSLLENTITKCNSYVIRPRESIGGMYKTPIADDIIYFEAQMKSRARSTLMAEALFINQCSSIWSKRLRAGSRKDNND